MGSRGHACVDLWELQGGSPPQGVCSMSRQGRALAILVPAAAFCLLAPLAARADFTTPTQIQTVPMTQTDWGPDNATHPVVPLQFEKFDPSLGTLTGVNIKLDYEFDSNVKLTFVNASTLSMVVQGYMALARPDATHSNIFDPAAANYPKFENVQSQTVNSGFPVTITSNQVFTRSIQTKLNDGSDLSLFTGPGSIGLRIGASVPVVNFN